MAPLNRIRDFQILDRFPTDTHQNTLMQQETANTPYTFIHSYTTTWTEGAEGKLS